MRLTPFLSDMDNLEPGDTVRVNHGIHCNAGEDTRRRLYLTRTAADPTVVVAYCHNCGVGGRWRDNHYAQYRDDTLKDHGPFTVPLKRDSLNLVHNPKDWPAQAQIWKTKCRLDNKDCACFGIAHDTNSDRIYLPMFDVAYTSICVAPAPHSSYQLRALHKDSKAKYLTMTDPKFKGYTKIVQSGGMTTTVVIVEDYVSGIHIIKAAQEHGDKVNCIVNYGVKVNPFVVDVASKYKNVIVWLDNDSAFVKKQAETYKRTLELYSIRSFVYSVTALNDPKNYTSREIHKMIRR